MASGCIKIATYNVNYSRRPEENKNKYGIFHWNERSEHVYDLMDLISPAIWAVTEVHQPCTENFIERMNRYYWFFTPQNSREGKLTNIGIGFEKISFSENDLEFFNYNFNQFNDGNENTACCYVKTLDMLVISIHFPTKLENRKNMVENFPKLLGTRKYSKLIIMGDFNSFPDIWGYQQMITLNGLCGTYSVSEFAINQSDGKYAKHSFEPYGYDVVPKKSLKMIGKLDHILVKGFVPTDNFLPIMHDTYMPGTNIHPSDHLPISVVLTFI